MLLQGGLTASICDCNISVVMRSPRRFLALAMNFLLAVFTARRVPASKTKYSSSIPNEYMGKDKGLRGGSLRSKESRGEIAPNRESHSTRCRRTPVCAGQRMVRRRGGDGRRSANATSRRSPRRPPAGEWRRCRRPCRPSPVGKAAVVSRPRGNFCRKRLNDDIAVSHHEGVGAQLVNIVRRLRLPDNVSVVAFNRRLLHVEGNAGFGELGKHPLE